MKRYVILFWQGLTGFLAGAANWFTVVLRMKDDSAYGKFIRRVVGTCFALIMVVLALAALYGMFSGITDTVTGVYKDYKSKPRTYYTQYVSRRVRFYQNEFGKKGYLADIDGNKILDGVAWIACPGEEDSLVCYSNGSKRGYFNKYTGEIVVKPQYEHAWIFSCGLASVCDKGQIKFIDGTGNVVIDNGMRYFPGRDGYIFRNGYCVVSNDRNDKVGLIDKQGKWVLPADYHSIECADKFWIVTKGRKRAVLSDSMKTVLPFEEADYEVNNDGIFATMKDHTIRKYSLQGDLLENFCVRRVDKLMYETDELHYSATKVYDDNGNVTGGPADYAPHFLETPAECRRYEAERGWYGLMSHDGRIITPPCYSEIIAVWDNRYLCSYSSGNGHVLDNEGNIVE